MSGERTSIFEAFMRSTPSIQSNMQQSTRVIIQQQQPQQQFQQQHYIISQPQQQEFIIQPQQHQQQQHLIQQQQPIVQQFKQIPIQQIVYRPPQSQLSFQESFQNQILQQQQPQQIQMHIQQAKEQQQQLQQFVQPHFQQQQQQQKQQQLSNAKIFTAEQVLQQITSNDNSLSNNNNNSNNIDYNPDFFFNEVEEIVGDTQEESTLWMSCSPGRDSVDGEDNDNEETSVSYESIKKYNPVNNSYDFVDEDQDFEQEEAAIMKKQEDKKLKIRNKNKKPISSYGLFFRDTQAAIEEQKPNASFSEVAHVVASMWDSLQEKHKQYYEKLAEMERQKARKERKKELNESTKSKEKLLKKSKEKKKSTTSPLEIAQLSKASNHPMCIREGCSNRAIDDTRWNLDYCSTQCVVSHCKDVFKAWVALRKDPNPEVEAC